MDLRKKLALLGGAGPGSRPAPPPQDPDAARKARIEQLRTLIRRTTLSGGSILAAAPIEPKVQRHKGGVLPGAEELTAHGRIHAVTRWLEPHHCHGRVRVASALEVSPALVAQLALDPALASVDLRRMLFVDTETTGLHGGAGTLPFLIGLAWFEDESLCVRQLFLLRPGEEAPMLHLLAERLRASSCVVTYNGKSFDWPLLRTRFVMNRVPMPEPPPHLDLLHCARRVLKPRLTTTRLVRVERDVLGMRREDDVDGADIPALYLRWLRHGEASPLAPVIEHNANDLIALAAVLARLVEHYGALRPEDDPRDHLGYARVAFRAGDEARAQSFARAAAEGGAGADVTLDALLLLARMARGARDPESEHAALARALDVAAPDRAPKVHLRLAKLYEHRLRDPARARAHAEHARDAETPEQNARRLARLDRRLEKRARARAAIS